MAASGRFHGVKIPQGEQLNPSEMVLRNFTGQAG
jgi:hypothetical protein